MQLSAGLTASEDKTEYEGQTAKRKRRGSKAFEELCLQ